jgi:hypothetical protein
MARASAAFLVAISVCFSACSDTERRSSGRAEADGGQAPADGNHAADAADGSGSSGERDTDGAVAETDGDVASEERAIGDPCTTDAECGVPEDARCYMDEAGADWPGGFCSKACDPGAGGECGPDAECASTGMSSGGGGTGMSFQFAYCAPSCSSDGDCRQAEGYTCKTLLIPGVGFCAPEGL